MKKGITLVAAAMMCIGATSCKASENKDDEDDEMTTSEEVDEAMAETEAEEGVVLPEDESPVGVDSANAEVATPNEERPVVAAEAGKVDEGLNPQKAVVDTNGYTTTPSGLKYKVVREGKGKKPGSPAAVVKVHYAGKHLDGTVFDSSYDRGEPISFPLNRVIKGWTEGVQLMKEGAKYQFIIPSELAYGRMGTPGGPIKPNEDLYFEVELLEVQ